MHNNTRADPYYSDSESGRRVDPERAIPLTREFLRHYGAVRARIGYFKDTPIIDHLRQRELSHVRVTQIRIEDYREANVVIGRQVPPENDWFKMGWGKLWWWVESSTKGALDGMI